MKNKLVFMVGMLTLALVLGMTVIACDNGGGGGGGGGARDPKTYTGTAEGVTYTLKIEDGGARAVLTPTQGDKYTLTQTANAKKSTGKVTKVVGGVLTLEPSGDLDDEFTATVSGNGISTMSGTITWDDGTANEAPTSFTPTVTPPNTGGGTDSNWTAVADSTIWQTTVEGETIRIGINCIAYGNNRFVAVSRYFSGIYSGYTNKMAYSADKGVTWTPVDISGIFDTTVFLGAIVYGNGKFVVVGSDGKMAYSADSAAWTPVDREVWKRDSDSDSYHSIDHIVYGNDKFVAVGDEGKMAYSSDGVTWSPVTNSPFDYYDGTINYDSSITFGNGKFVAVGDTADRDNGKIAASTDGINWTAVDVDSANWQYTDYNGDSRTAVICPIAFGNGKFVVAGEYGKMAYSTDGASWTPVANSAIWRAFSYNNSDVMSDINTIIYGGNRFVAVGDYGKVAYSADGVTWAVLSNMAFGKNDPQDPDGAGTDVYSVAYGNGRFIIGSSNGKMAWREW